jgi:hypothetical protein
MMAAGAAECGAVITPFVVLIICLVGIEMPGKSCASRSERNWTKGAGKMARKIYKPEEIVNLLRQVGAAVANGKMTPQACKDAGIVEQTYYRWRKEYGELKVDQARRLSLSRRTRS